MQSANAYLELLRERGKRGLPLERVYRHLFNPDLYLNAYGKIYRNTGAMTKGVTDETPDGMSLDKITTIIEALRFERYQWKPARRTYIPKKNGKKFCNCIISFCWLIIPRELPFTELLHYIRRMGNKPDGKPLWPRLKN